jgi:hypothetical protein
MLGGFALREEKEKYMITELSAGIAGLKTVADLAALVLKMNVDAAVKQKAEESNFAIINAQSLMLELQVQYQELLSQKNEIEKRLVEIEDWNVKAANYELKEMAGVFFFALKADQETPTPAHWLCCGCYQKRQEGILCKTVKDAGGYLYRCPLCHETYRLYSSPSETK